MDERSAAHGVAALVSARSAQPSSGATIVSRVPAALSVRALADREYESDARALLMRWVGLASSRSFGLSQHSIPLEYYSNPPQFDGVLTAQCDRPQRSNGFEKLPIDPYRRLVL